MNMNALSWIITTLRKIEETMENSRKWERLQAAENISQIEGRLPWRINDKLEEAQKADIEEAKRQAVAEYIEN
jgi:hypothetical protein